MVELVLLGTSHIAKQSVEEIKHAIIHHKPDVVAVELDKKRLHALVTNQKSRIRLTDIRRIGFSGFIFAAVGSYIQKKLGKLVDIQPGADMLAAVQTATKNNISVALIDQDIETTLRRFSKSFTWKERVRIVTDIIRGLLFPKKELKKYGLHTIDLNSVPSQEIIEHMIEQVRNRYPSIYQTIIHQRNLVMINNLANLIQNHPTGTILVVIGAGHKKAIEQAFTSAT